jgi:hypothetical protein
MTWRLWTMNCVGSASKQSWSSIRQHFIVCLYRREKKIKSFMMKKKIRILDKSGAITVTLWNSTFVFEKHLQNLYRYRYNWSFICVGHTQISIIALQDNEWGICWLPSAVKKQCSSQKEPQSAGQKVRADTIETYTICNAKVAFLWRRFHKGLGRWV